MRNAKKQSRVMGWLLRRQFSSPVCGPPALSMFAGGGGVYGGWCVMVKLPPCAFHIGPQAASAFQASVPPIKRRYVQ